MRAKRSWLALGIAVCGWHRSAHAQLVEPLVQPAIELSNRWDAEPVEVPLKLSDKAALDKEALVQRVDVGDRQQPTLLHGFVATTAGARLKIETLFARVHLPRSYKVWIELAGQGATGPAKQLVTVDLVLPPATLEPVQPFVINHGQWPWGSSPANLAELKLPLHETSGVTSIKRLSLAQAHPVLNGDQQVPVALVPVLPPAELWAGRRTVVTFKAEGVEVGTTRGNLVVSAEELATPLQVPFEIRTKIYDWLIIPWYMLFGLVGWLVRHRLQDAAARAALVVRSAALIKRADELKVTVDGKLSFDLTNGRAAVTSALEQPDNQVLSSALTALATLLDLAGKQRDEEVAGLFTKIAAAKQDLPRKPDLPAGLTLDEPLASLAQSERLLSQDNLPGAREAFEQHKTGIDALGAHIARWGKDALIGLHAFEQGANDPTGSLLPDRVPAEARDLLQKLRSELSAATYELTARPPSMLAYLASVQAANADLSRFFFLVKSATEAELDAVARGLDDQTKLSKIAEIRKRLAGDSNKDVTKDDLDELAAALRACHTTIAAWLTSVEAKDLLRQGKAAEALGEETTPHSQPRRQQISDDDASGPASVHMSRTPAAAPPTSPSQAPRIAVLRVAAPPSAAHALIELQTIELTRTVVSAGILSVVAWLAYRQTWVGTVNDFAGVAAVAFITDLTLDAVLDAMSKLKRPTPA